MDEPGRDEAMTVFTVRLPRACKDELKRIAAARNGTVTDVVRRALREYVKEDAEPGRWWRSVAPDGSLWGESSNEAEVREMARPGDRIERMWVYPERTEWRESS